MGKKGSWFSAIKKVFTPNSKDKRADGTVKKSSSTEKKKGKGAFRPLFREPSSIEKILGEADELLIRPPTSSERPNFPPALPARVVSPRPASPKAASSPKSSSPRVASPKAPSPRVASPRADSSKTFLSTGAVSPKAAPPTAFATGATSSKTAAPPPSKAAALSKAASPKVTQSRKEARYVQRAEPTLRDQQLSATKIQAAYRGCVARRSFRALRGLVRLQSVVKGQNVKRQTMNAMKQMQLLVRVQTQIQSQRIQMLESQALQHQAYKNDNEAESTMSKWNNQLSEAGQNGDWDDSRLTKEEAEARLRKRVEAVIKRERAMAYAYSNALWKSTPKSAQNSSSIRSNGFPWWWNWLERQLPQAGISQSPAATRSTMLTPPRSVSEFKPSPFPASSIKLGNLMFDNHESVTPRSSRSAVPVRAKQFQTTPTRTPQESSSSYIKYSKPRANAANSAYDGSVKDDDSLMSCPPFSVPNYMTPTVSAKAKARAYSNPRERFPGTSPGSSNSTSRFSFPLTPNVGSFKWNKGSNRETVSQIGSEKREDSRSIGDLSVDSTVSMPAALVGRRPFNRFV